MVVVRCLDLLASLLMANANANGSSGGREGRGGLQRQAGVRKVKEPLNGGTPDCSLICDCFQALGCLIAVCVAKK